MHMLLERGFWRAGKMEKMRDKEGGRDDKREKSLIRCQCPAGQLTVGTLTKNSLLRVLHVLSKLLPR